MQKITISLDPSNPTLDLVGNADVKEIITEMVVGMMNIMSNATSSDINVKRAEMQGFAESLSDFTTVTVDISETNINDTDEERQDNVIQLDMDGNIIAFYSNASFSKNKSESKEILGGIQQTNNREVLIADSINKKVMLVDGVTKKTKWEYTSDRYVLDARVIYPDSINIAIDVSSATNTELKISRWQNVVWENISSLSMFIYSSETLVENFSTDLDLSLYGTIFKSPELSSKDRFSFKFNDIGEFNWFSYPNVISGTINVYEEFVPSFYQFVILESDSLESPFNSRVIKVDFLGNILWSFGEGLFTAPKDIRLMSNGNILISC